MDRVYMICILIGLTVPLLSLVLGSLLDIFDGVFEAFDLGFDVEVGHLDICIEPLSMQSICAALLVFGCMGKLIEPRYGTAWATGTGLVLGYVLAVVIQSFMRGLRRVVNTTYSREELIHFEAKVVNTIQTDGFGSVSIKTGDGVSNTYPARAEDKRDSIKAGMVVEVIRFEKHTAIVRIKAGTGDSIIQKDKQEEA